MLKTLFLYKKNKEVNFEDGEYKFSKGIENYLIKMDFLVFSKCPLQKGREKPTNKNVIALLENLIDYKEMDT